jgi:DNA repair exonuclease SbcCD ATPase subunit
MQEQERRIDLATKVAALEENIEDIHRQVEELKSDFKDHNKSENEWRVQIDKRFDTLESLASNTKSFMGGITFVIGGIWLFVSTFKDWIANHFSF